MFQKLIFETSFFKQKNGRETPYAADTFLLSLQVKVFLYYEKTVLLYLQKTKTLSEYIVYKKNRRDITSYRGNKQHKGE